MKLKEGIKIICKKCGFQDEDVNVLSFKKYYISFCGECEK